MELHPGDFYIENGAMVFTAQYHLRRGYCCESGCRHCPYRGRPDESERKAGEPSPGEVAK